MFLTVSLTGKSFAFMVSVAGHEEGHALGVGHSSVRPALMNQERDRERTYSPQADDVAAVKALY